MDPKENIIKEAKPEKPLTPGQRALRIVLLSLALLLIFAIGVSVAIPSVNNRIASGVMKKLAKAPLPEGSSVIEKKWFAGNLVGNGNKMQYLGALLVKSNMSASELEAFYEGATGLDCTVTAQVGSTVAGAGSADAAFDTSPAGEGWFAVIAWGSSSLAVLDLDLRAH